MAQKEMHVQRIPDIAALYLELSIQLADPNTLQKSIPSNRKVLVSLIAEDGEMMMTVAPLPFTMNISALLSHSPFQNIRSALAVKDSLERSVGISTSLTAYSMTHCQMTKISLFNLVSMMQKPLLH